MLSQKRVETQKLITFVKLLSKDNNKINYVVEPKQDFKNRDNTFKCLNRNETKMTNDLPPKLRSYFDPFIKEFIRHGSTKTYITNENVSLYYSILKSCIPKFSECDEQKQIEYIKSLREKLVAYISNTEIFKTNGYDKMKWNKKSIIQSLMQFKVTKLTLKLLADYFSVNIFMLNILEDKLYVVSGNDYYDMFRYNVFVASNTNTFESLSYLDEYMLTYDNVLVKKVISIHKNILILFNTNLNETPDALIPLEFNIKLDDFNIVLPLNKENDYDEITESESNFVKDVEVKHEKTEEPSTKLQKPESKITTEEKPITGVVFNVSQKMKLDALQEMAAKLNIDINKLATNGKPKPKTKIELVDEINMIMIK